MTDELIPAFEAASSGREKPIIAEPSSFAFVRKRKTKNGLTMIEDAFARRVAEIPEELLDNELMCKLYLEIPGVTMKKGFSAVRYTHALAKRPYIKKQIDLYRIVLGNDKLSLMAKREDVTQKIVERWEGDPKAIVKTADVLTAFKDRETAYGIGTKTAEEVSQLLNNKRLQEGFQEINITPGKGL